MSFTPSPLAGEIVDADKWLALFTECRLLQASGASVATSQTTTSLTYTDLATAGPAVTLDTGTQVEVTITATMSNSSAGNSANMSFAISGASTQAAGDSTGVITISTAGQRFSATYLVTGLTAGSNTFTAKYRVFSAGTGTFVDRNIHVKP